MPNRFAAERYPECIAQVRAVAEISTRLGTEPQEERRLERQALNKNCDILVSVGDIG